MLVKGSLAALFISLTGKHVVVAVLGLVVQHQSTIFWLAGANNL